MPRPLLAQPHGFKNLMPPATTPGRIAVLGRMCHVPNDDFDNVLDNDSDPDQDEVYFSRVIDEPAKAVFMSGPHADGSFDLAPIKLGDDYFTYKATDLTDESNEAWVFYEVVAPGVDIDTDSDNNGIVDQTPYEDSVEADEPGGSGGSGGGTTVPGNILHLNHDDDNNNQVEDRAEGPGPLGFNDDDLELAVLKVDEMAASAWVGGAPGGSEGWLDGGGLVDKQYKPKPVYDRLKKLVHDEWNTRAEAKTDTQGATTFRGFFGPYQVTVKTEDGKSQTFDAVLGKGQENVWTFTVGK